MGKGNLTLGNIRLGLITIVFLSAKLSAENTSQCYGTPEKGRLVNGWQLPASGSNYSAYSMVGVAAGRNYVHSSVYDVVLNSYQSLARVQPGKVFVYGETRWSRGGRFRPHKTHQNGLSVDFFVPVINRAGKSVPFPASPLNKFGYDIEFSTAGKIDGYSIDFDAMAAHLFELKKAADLEGIKIGRVIFDNELQKMLFNTSHGSELKTALTFSTKKPWVRHDEHYHIDFIVPCK